MPIDSSKAKLIQGKFIDLRQKASFWIELIRAFPRVCAFECWKPCFDKAILAHDKLWSFQQENRKHLDTCEGFTREVIGDIAFDIALLYFHYYLRDSSKQHLRRSLLFFEAIQSRSYFRSDSEKCKSFLLAFGIAKLIAGDLIKCQELLNSGHSTSSMDADCPSGTLSSPSMSQGKIILKDVEALIRATCGGALYLNGPVRISNARNAGSSIRAKSMLSLACSDSAVFGELSIGGLLLNSLADRLLEGGVRRLFLVGASPMELMSASFELMRSTTSDDILLLHSNCQFQRTLDGKDILFLMEGPGREDEDKILTLEQVSLLRRRVFFVSEEPISAITALVPENVFLLTPASMISLFGIEVSLHQLYMKMIPFDRRREQPGRIEDIVRTQSQLFSKLIVSTCADALIKDPRTGPFTQCPLCFHLLLTHLMTVYLFKWMEMKGLPMGMNNLRGNLAASNLFPFSSTALHNRLQLYPTALHQVNPEVIQFLDSLVNN